MKPTIPCGIAVATDGLLPGKCNLLSFASAVKGYTFEANVMPQRSITEVKGFWRKFPQEMERFAQGAETLPKAMKRYLEWLHEARGTLVAVGEGMDFWFLYDALLEGVGKCPFADRPVDLRSWVSPSVKAVRFPTRERTAKEIAALPLVEIAKERLDRVIGKKAKKEPMAKKRAFWMNEPTYQIAPNQPTWTQRAQRLQEALRATPPPAPMNAEAVQELRDMLTPTNAVPQVEAVPVDTQVTTNAGPTFTWANGWLVAGTQGGRN